MADPDDIFLANFGRWHFHNCIGLQTDSYTQSLAQLCAFFQVRWRGRACSRRSMQLAAGSSNQQMLCTRTLRHRHCACPVDQT